MAGAFLENQALQKPVTPARPSKPTCWIYHELRRLLGQLHSPRRAAARLLVILNGKEAVFDWHDPLPFLRLHHWQIPLLLLRDLQECKGWLKIDLNIGKLVQAGGD